MKANSPLVSAIAAVSIFGLLKLGAALPTEAKASRTAAGSDARLPAAATVPGDTVTTAAFKKAHPSGITAAARKATRVTLSKSYGKLPLHFEANQGQTDEKVKFLSRGRGYTLFLTATEAVLALRKARGEKSPKGSEPAGSSWRSLGKADKVETAVLRMRLVGANALPRLAGLDELPGKANYFVGGDPGKWHTNVPTYGKVKCEGIYPGIDVIYYGKQRQLEHDFVVEPGTDPSVIRLAFEGAYKLSLNDEGDLILGMKGGKVVLKAPMIYQDIGGARRQISGSYVLEANNQVGFQVAAYDLARQLVIDPMLAYSTYLGGAGWDYANAIAVDQAGNAYVTGSTTSADFPTEAPVLGTRLGVADAFVTKLNPAGSAVYSTYLGGAGPEGEDGQGIAVDGAGNAYVTGLTTSSTFPTVSAIQPSYAGSGDAFVTKLNPAGSALVYSTYLGGSGADNMQIPCGGIAVDSLSNAYVTGCTNSDDFPTVNPIQASRASISWYHDAFVTKLNAAGSALVYSTYLGGTGHEWGTHIAVDSLGNALIVGTTRSNDFPTSNAIQGAFAGGLEDSFVIKIDATGSALLYSTYLGGNSYDQGRGIAVDSFGNAYVTGITKSTNFPTANPIQPVIGNPAYFDAFVTKLNSGGSAFVYSTYLGGNSHDQGWGVALDSSGNAYVTGSTSSTDFPTVDPIQGALAGPTDAFITALDRWGSELMYSTYLGGSGQENDIGYGGDIAVDNCGNAYLTGTTNSTDFPTINPFQQDNFGGDDAFVAKLGRLSLSTILSETSSTESTLTETISAQTATLTNATVDGNLTGTLDFTNLEIVQITTGPFTGNGFSTGDVEITLEGFPYEGRWHGSVFFKPDERKISLQGSVSGQVSATVEGYLTEWTPGSGVYDQYEATWKIGHLGSGVVSAVIELSGTLVDQAETEFPGTELYVLQSSFEGTLSGDYSGPVQVVLTHLRVAEAGNPYEGRGFSQISHVSDAGAGQGWTYDEAGCAGSNGMFDNPLFGVVSASLREEELPRTLWLAIERVDLASPPAADLTVQVWGPSRVSPGQTVNYTTEYRNDGTKSSDAFRVILTLPDTVEYVSSTAQGIYHPLSHNVVWHVENLSPWAKEWISAKVTAMWGLPMGTIIEPIVSVEEDEEDLGEPPLQAIWDAEEIGADYVNMLAALVDGRDVFDSHMSVSMTETTETMEPVLDINEAADGTHIHMVFSMPTNLSSERQRAGGTNTKVEVEVDAEPEIGLLLRAKRGLADWFKQTPPYKLWEEFQDARYWAQMNDRFVDYIAVDTYPTFYDQLATDIKWQIGKSKWLPWVGKGVKKAPEMTKMPPAMQVGFEASLEVGRVFQAVGIGNILNIEFGKELESKPGFRLWLQAHDAELGHPTTGELYQAYFEWWYKTKYLKKKPSDSFPTSATPAHDPNAKWGPEGDVDPGQRLDYQVEFENEGAGIAFGVYFTDTLDEDLDESTLEIGPVLSTGDDSEIAPAGTYNPSIRTITWLVGEVGPGEGGYTNLGIDVRSDAPKGTEIINFATVYFPSVPEVTRTNGVVSVIPFETCDDGQDNDSNGLVDCEDSWCSDNPDCMLRSDYDFLCYKTRAKQNISDVTLADEFDAGSSYQVKLGRLFCTPADRGGQGIFDGETHLMSYKIRGPHEPRTSIEVENEFGGFFYDTKKTDTLMVPSAKSLAPPAPDPPDPNGHLVNHYRCLKAKTSRGKDNKFPRALKRLPLIVKDQFGSRAVFLKKPSKLCLPVDKNGEGIKNPNAHLVCYKVKAYPRHSATGIQANNQFGEAVIDLKKEAELCVPSIKIVPTTSTTTTSTTTTAS